MIEMRPLIIAPWLLAGAAFGHAALPPKYLEVDEFGQCLAEQSKGTYTAWCMPVKRPKACPRPSWEHLRTLKGRDAVPPCPAKAPG